MAQKIFSTWKEAFFLFTHPVLWFRKPLEVEHLAADPVDQFTRWFDEAKRQWSGEFPNWLCLSTLNADGYPEGRIVLLKSYDQRGFVFYTNTESVKGKSLDLHPKASMTFYWERLQHQVRVVGDIEFIDDDEADQYFNSRPRESQLGAWASDQSAPLKSREKLVSILKSYESKFEGEPVPRPPHWTGYRLQPVRFEFWELRLSRLHDRFLYERNQGEWKIYRLNP